MSTKKRSEEEVTNAKNLLWERVERGAKVYTILRHVSKSGMQREISFVVAYRGDIVSLDYYVGVVLGLKHGSRGGLIIRGCGMDMGYDMVHSLSSVLYQDWYFLIHDWL
jgi:hypothetical protein